MSALGSGHACPTTVIASVHRPLYGAISVRRVISGSFLVPVASRCTRLLDSTGLCVNAGQRSFPPRVAVIAGPTRPHQVGLRRGLRFKNPVGTGAVKVSHIPTYNIQGVKQHDPSVLHDTVEAVEGESGAGDAERDPCDDASKSSACRGVGIRGGGGGFRQGKERKAAHLKSPKLQVPYTQVTATKQQHMHQTESPKLQHIATTWAQNCVFQEEPSASTNVPEPTVPCTASYSFAIVPGPSQETQRLQLL